MTGSVPTGRLCDTAAEKKAKLRRGSKLHPIDRGTIYDVTGKMRKWIREMESGDNGDVTDVVMAYRFVKDGRVGVRTKWLGRSQQEVLHWMAVVLQKDMVPE